MNLNVVVSESLWLLPNNMVMLKDGLMKVYNNALKTAGGGIVFGLNDVKEKQSRAAHAFM